MKHIEHWNIWRQDNTKGPLHHILVLFGVVHSPTLCLYYTESEMENLHKRLAKIK